MGEPSTKTKSEKREEVGLPLPGFRESKEPVAARINTMDMLKDTAEGPIRRQSDEVDGDGKDKGSDWIVGYNPGVQTNLNIDLLHNLNHSSVVCCVKFSADGKYLATGCNKSAQIYDIESGRKVHTFIDDCVKDGDLYIRSVCFSPDGQHLATGAEDKTVKVWDITHKRILHTFTGHELDIYSLDFSQDGRFIVSGSGDKKAKIWDIEKGRCAFTLGNEEVGPKDGVTSVAISPDGRLVAAGSLDRIVRLWDAQTGYFLERYEGHADSVYSVAFSPDGKSLASGSLDKTLKLWDLSGSRARSRCRSTFNGHKDFVLSVAFSPDGNWLISGSKDRSVQFWDPRSAVTHMMLQGHKNSVISVALSPAGGVFATGSGDYRARLWKYES
jgi:glucose repression regulatory protein TUP1